MKEIIEILKIAFDSNFSDLFLTAGKVAYIRRNGEVLPETDLAILSAETIDRFRQSILPPSGEAEYQQHGSYDASYSMSPLLRFRINFFNTLTGPALAARPVRQGSSLSIDTLHLPQTIAALADEPRGLILVSGSTGSGKSTTLGAMINHINQKYHKHILTIEDPIEFIHEDKQSLVTQREINSNAMSFVEALRSAMRENPDVIVIGEMRDTETMQVAINAALTGHLVISTVHTADTVQAIERIINLFPEDQRQQVAIDLGMAILGIVAQRLLPGAKKNGMYPAVELMMGTPSVKKLIADRNFRALEDALKEGSNSGMITFNRAIFRMLQEKTIDLATAMEAVNNRDEFQLLLRGMESGVDAFRNHYGDKEEDGEELIDMSCLLRSAVKMGSSDLLLSTYAYPCVRLDGVLRAMDLPVLLPIDTQRLLFSIITPHQRIEFEEKRELDFALSVTLNLDGSPDGGKIFRFRVNAFFQRGNIGIVARVISSAVPTPEQLSIPPILTSITNKQQGLILVTGPTGSGKTTTLASLIDYINRSRAVHIITIEDPIEYVHENRNAVIEQRELHADTVDFATALKYTLRQDPDVILVGEMRDIATIAAALTAAETGHLVLATIHTNNAPQTIDRIVDSFPEGQQNQIRLQLAGVLLAVVSQRLLTRLDGNGRVAAFEIMIGTPPVQALVRDGKTHQLQSSIETGHKDGMVTLEKALDKLYNQGVVSFEEVQTYKVDCSQVKAF